MQKLLVFLLLSFPAVSFSYPQFIGHKYTSCITCHFNTQGGGQLNDYGRALWATEIAGRNFASNLSVEELGEISGLLGAKELPWWTRLGAKFRQIWMRTNPARENSVSRDILMQADANVSFFLDRGQRYGIVSTLGYASEDLQTLNLFVGKSDSSFISREHYLRLQVMEPLWLSIGKLDKVYGLRQANHTAYSRARLGLSQNDQVYGAVAHYIKSAWELTLNVFAGDLAQDEDFREQGFSVMFEHDIEEAWRIGGSFLMSDSDALERNLLGMHSRVGIGNGTALIAEAGLIFSQRAQAANSEAGYYFYSEATQKIKRGNYIFVTAQAFKNDMTSEVSDLMKLGLGYLFFPLQRVELRLDIENSYRLDPSFQSTKDSWSFLGQIHLSL